MERVLLLVEDTPGSGAAAAWGLKLAQALSARLFAVCVIPAAPQKGPSNNNRHLSHVEERAWQSLYEIEDDAFEVGVKISLLLEQGDTIERLCDVCQSYRVDLVAVSADTRLDPARLLHRAVRPVVFVKSPKEV